MRNVIIPEDNPSNCINLLEINEDFDGVILCFRVDKFIGFIVYNLETWVFSTGIDVNNGCEENLDLRKLVKCIKKDYCITDFRVLEYDKQKRNFRGSSTQMFKRYVLMESTIY